MECKYTIGNTGTGNLKKDSWQETRTPPKMLCKVCVSQLIYVQKQLFFMVRLPPSLKGKMTKAFGIITKDLDCVTQVDGWGKLDYTLWRDLNEGGIDEVISMQPQGMEEVQVKISQTHSFRVERNESKKILSRLSKEFDGTCDVWDDDYDEFIVINVGCTKEEAIGFGKEKTLTEIRNEIEEMSQRIREDIDNSFDWADIGRLSTGDAYLMDG